MTPARHLRPAFALILASVVALLTQPAAGEPITV